MEASKNNALDEEEKEEEEQVVRRRGTRITPIVKCRARLDQVRSGQVKSSLLTNASINWKTGNGESGMKPQLKGTIYPSHVAPKVASNASRCAFLFPIITSEHHPATRGEAARCQ